MNDRERRAAMLTKLALHLPLRDMADGEADEFWSTWLDDTAHIDPDRMEQICARVRREPGRKWFPTVGEFLAHAKAVRDVNGTPTRADLLKQQSQELLPAPKWTEDDVERARKAWKAMPDGYYKDLLGGVLREKEAGLG